MSGPWEDYAPAPRGIRNNNPGNIEDGGFARSVPGYKGSDGRFAVYDTPEAGNAAQTKLLQSYGKRGVNTVEGIVNRWAPPKENDTGAYVRFVAQKAGLDPRAPIDMNDPAVVSRVQAAMAEHENGRPVAQAESPPWMDYEGGAPERISTSKNGGVTVDRIPQKPPQMAAPAPLRADDGLGFLKGATTSVFNASGHLQRAVEGSALGDNMASQGAALRGLIPEGLTSFIDNPQGFFDKQAEGGRRPGKLGEFAGNVAATSLIPGGPLVQGAVGGALMSDKKDLAGVAGDAALGGAVGRLTALGSDAVQLGARKVLSKVPQVMDLPALKAAKTALYDQAEKSGFTFASNEVRKLANDFASEVRAKGGPKAAQLIPAADAFAARLGALAKQKGGVTLSQLDALRGDIYDNLIQKGGAEAQQGYALRKSIDDLMDASQAPFIKAARAANTKFEKVSEVTNRIKSAGLAAGRSNSGENVVNAVRQKLSPMVDPLHTGQVKNLTPDESSLIERIVGGDKVSNGLRNTSKLLRNKFVSGPLAVMTGAGAGPWSGLALMGGLEAAGQGMRRSAEKYTQKQINELLRTMSAGGSKQALAPVPTKASQAAETAIAKVLRPALVASAVPALAAAKPPQKTKPKK